MRFNHIEQLEEVLACERERLAIAERRRPRDVAGASASEPKDQAARMRAKVERLERLVADVKAGRA